MMAMFIKVRQEWPGEQAKERAIDFIQVLHGIHAEFQTTDASIAGYINSHTGTGSEELYSSAKH